MERWSGQLEIIEELGLNVNGMAIALIFNK
jgi:hypothetical protein